VSTLKQIVEGMAIDIKIAQRHCAEIAAKDAEIARLREAVADWEDWLGCELTQEEYDEIAQKLREALKQ